MFIPCVGSIVVMGIVCSAAVVKVSLFLGKWNTSLYSSQILMRETLSSLFKLSVLNSLRSLRNRVLPSLTEFENIKAVSSGLFSISFNSTLRAINCNVFL